jgi:hypothetical protein
MFCPHRICDFIFRVLGDIDISTLFGHLPLTHFVTLLRFVDDKHPTFTSHELVIAVATKEGFEGVADLHSATEVNDKKWWARQGSNL